MDVVQQEEQAVADEPLRIDSFEARVRQKYPDLYESGMFEDEPEPQDLPSILSRLKRNERVSLQAVLYAAKSPELTGRMYHLWCYFVAKERALGGLEATRREIAEAISWNRYTVKRYLRRLIDAGWLRKGDERSVYYPQLPPHLEDVPVPEREGLPDWFLGAVTDSRLIDPVGDVERVGSGYQRFCAFMLFRAHGDGEKRSVWVRDEKMARSLGISESYFRRVRKYLDRDGWLVKDLKAEGCPEWKTAYRGVVPPSEDQHTDADEMGVGAGLHIEGSRAAHGTEQGCADTTGCTTGRTTGLSSDTRSSDKAPADSTGASKSPKQPETKFPEAKSTSKNPGSEEGDAREKPEFERVPPAASRQGDPFEHRDPEWASGQTANYRERFAEAVEKRVVT